jgi:hypothetical protein
LSCPAESNGGRAGCKPLARDSPGLECLTRETHHPPTDPAPRPGPRAQLPAGRVLVCDAIVLELVRLTPNDLPLVHYDRDYERIAAVSTLQQCWFVPHGALA